MRRAWFRSCGVPSFIVAPCRRFVAVAEKAEKATVTIFDLTSTNLKKKRPLTCQECLSREYAPFAWALGSTEFDVAGLLSPSPPGTFRLRSLPMQSI